MGAAQAPIGAAEKRQVIDSLARTLEARYVFPDVGNRVAADLRARLGRGEYDSLTSGPAFAERLTANMAAIAHDGHLNVRFTDGEDSFLNERPSAEEEAKRQRWAKARNYGFERVERLSGNIGYLELRGFMPVAMMRETALAAMRFLNNTDALIIDLRRNGGGEPAAVALLSTWLFPKGKKVHLNDLYWREGNRTESFYTDPRLDVPRYTGAVYVLTSTRTFSAAEEFTYNLKNLKRATQVGETTGGGANPGGGVLLTRNFGVFMPTGRAINPISKDNWEGKGNVPEIATSAEDALRVAHIKAIEELMAKEKDPDMRRGYEMTLQELQAKTS
ncbi:MAG TPA: S41 family peptidase [Gemmatimonadales bacterium]|nr:S41 family peptidase [Gemmatimonadales bacterium]